LAGQHGSLALARKTLAVGLQLGIVLVLWGALLDFPRRAADTGLDDSWAQALGHFLKHQAQAGVDYHFTYGPLGFFLTWTYEPDLFWYKVAWELVIKLVFALTIVRALAPLSWPARLAGCLVIAAFLHLLLALPDIPCQLILLLHTTFLLSPRGRYPTASTLGSTGLITLLSLTKFTLFLYSLIAVAAVVFCLAATRQHRRALVVLGGYAGSLAVWWLALGQSLAHLPSYLYGACQVAAGYGEALALDGDRSELYLAVVIIGLLAATLLTFRRAGRPGLPGATGALVIGLALFLQWKNGFIRHDHHCVGFFAFALALPFVLPATLSAYDWRAPARVVLLAYALLLSAAGLEIAQKDHKLPYTFNPLEVLAESATYWKLNVTRALRPAQLNTHLREEQAHLTALAQLPRIQATVGDASVDVMSYELGLALQNRLHWRPRPGLQSYSAATPFLLAADARHLAGPDAPEYVIFKLQPLDWRLPALEDGAALLELLHQYQPVLFERAYLLFKRRPAAAPLTGRGPRERVIHLNEEVAIDDDGGLPQRLTLDVQDTKAATLRKLLLKLPPLFIRVRTDQGYQYVFRFIPSMARTGFLINPLLQTTRDLTQLYGTGGGQRVVSFCIFADPEAPRCYRSEIRMTLEALPDLCAPLDPVALNRLQFPTFETFPAEVHSSAFVQVEECQGNEVLVVHPDGQMKFAVPAGAQQVQGQFGIHPLAYERGDTDGVQFVVEYQPDGGPARVLFERYLDPRSRAQDRGMQTLAVSLPSPCAGSVRFKTVNLPGKNWSWDWSYWCGVRIK
jgi:hypothetical protein